ncbi:MAG: helix-turn-helix domain-containing protein [Candidatus Undinarchaeales archaeon]|jgi:DNA-binding HxlR family transcriptional regulator|nr:helix-turn-helix domain-containing protein [Candidatus Undinarchaeales archaeon]MDP7493570.1 helix-turn-helix domain-containing protein [Candidatus Undinarchaeales archaeon]
MDKECTVYQSTHLFGKRWTLLILLELYRGNGGWKRFSKIKKSMDEITPKMLSARLKELEHEGLVMNQVDASSFPVKSEYKLTGSGEDFISVIQALKQWTLRWRGDNVACSQANCAKCVL